MKIEAKDALLLQGVIQGNSAQGLSTFLLYFVDAEGKEKFAVVGCKPSYEESFLKAIKRMISLRVPGFPELSTMSKPKEDPEGNSKQIQVHEYLTAEQTQEKYKDLMEDTNEKKDRGD